MISKMIGADETRRDIWVIDNYHHVFGHQVLINMTFKEDTQERLRKLASDGRRECLRGQAKNVKDEEATHMPNVFNR